MNTTAYVTNVSSLSTEHHNQYLVGYIAALEKKLDEAPEIPSWLIAVVLLLATGLLACVLLHLVIMCLFAPYWMATKSYKFGVEHTTLLGRRKQTTKNRRDTTSTDIHKRRSTIEYDDDDANL